MECPSELGWAAAAQVAKAHCGGRVVSVLEVRQRAHCAHEEAARLTIASAGGIQRKECRHRAGCMHRSTREGEGFVAIASSAPGCQ